MQRSSETIGRVPYCICSQNSPLGHFKPGVVCVYLNDQLILADKRSAKRATAIACWHGNGCKIDWSSNFLLMLLLLLLLYLFLSLSQARALKKIHDRRPDMDDVTEQPTLFLFFAFQQDKIQFSGKKRTLLNSKRKEKWWCYKKAVKGVVAWWFAIYCPLPLNAFLIQYNITYNYAATAFFLLLSWPSF